MSRVYVAIIIIWLKTIFDRSVFTYTTVVILSLLTVVYEH